MATKKKAEKLDAETAKNMVAEYMRKEYRPYAISDLVLNLHNKINKVSMAKILDELVDENTVIIKRYGKLSFYCCSERKCEANDKPITLEMLRELDNEIDILKKDSGELICAISELKHQLTDIELENKIEALTLENKMLLEQIKFQESQTSNNLQSTGMEHQIEITTIELEEKKAEKKYRKMKKIHDNILETLREGIDNFEQELENLGVERIPKLSFLNPHTRT